MPASRFEPYDARGAVGRYRYTRPVSRGWRAPVVRWPGQSHYSTSKAAGRKAEIEAPPRKSCAAGPRTCGVEILVMNLD
jgi:hypothetical protein